MEGLHSRECKNCGAPLKRGRACEYCGTIYEWELALSIDGVEFASCVPVLEPGSGGRGGRGGRGGSGLSRIIVCY